MTFKLTHCQFSGSVLPEVQVRYADTNLNCPDVDDLLD
jgi:hypothetical protein